MKIQEAASNVAVIDKKEKSKCQTNHINQGHLQIKLPLILILQM